LSLAYAASIVADVGTTIYLLQNVPNSYETNPVLGRHPGRLKIYAWAVGAIVAQNGVSILLPRYFREIWQVASLSYEMTGPIGNARLIGQFRVSF